jgi:NADH-quinone oxidoreductase subunit N
MSMAGYVLVVQERARLQALEATLKIFIFGAVAFAIMAYGLSFLYGLTGSLDFSTVGVGLPSADRLWIALALVLILVGYGFEITMVPLHFWAPDVFAGASGPVAGFLAVVPKIAGVAALLRFLLQALPAETVAWPL